VNIILSPDLYLSDETIQPTPVVEISTISILVSFWKCLEKIPQDKGISSHE
jgi:hypothetical protein